MPTDGYYARLNGGGGCPILPVMYVMGEMKWDDNTEPYKEGIYYDGNVIAVGPVYFDHVYRRCAPISRDTAYGLAPALVELVEKG